MKHPFLKFGAFTIATAATAVGSKMLADESMKKFVKGVLADGETKLRKPKDDNMTYINKNESVVREAPVEPHEEILPNININEVASVIDKAAFKGMAPKIIYKPEEQLDQQTPANNEPVMDEPVVMNNRNDNQDNNDNSQIPFTPAKDKTNDEKNFEAPFAAAPIINPEVVANTPEVPIADPMASINPDITAQSMDTPIEISSEVNQPIEPQPMLEEQEMQSFEQQPVEFQEQSIEPEIQFNNFVDELPFSPASQPLEMNTEPTNVDDNMTFEMPQQPQMPVEPQLPNQPDIPVAPQMPVTPQSEPQQEIPVAPSTPTQPSIPPEQFGTNANMNYNYVDNQVQQETVDENVMVTRPISDEPTVILPEEVQEMYHEQSVAQGEEQEIELVTHPSYIQQPDSDVEVTATPTSSQYQAKQQPQVQQPNQQQSPSNTYGEPIFDEPVKVGKTKIIGTNVVSDEPSNLAIEMVAAKYPNVEKSRLVSIMAQDGAGIVFEFSTNFKRNEDTLINVYSTTSDGDVVLPTDAERAGALQFGKSFITDKPELSEFFNR